MWVPVVAARDIGETAAMEIEVATPTMALMVPGSASPLLGCYGATTPAPILGALISVKRHSRPSGVGRWCYFLVGICLCESNMHVCVFSGKKQEATPAGCQELSDVAHTEEDDSCTQKEGRGRLDGKRAFLGLSPSKSMTQAGILIFLLPCINTIP